jgi:hypothetical protein
MPLTVTPSKLVDINLDEAVPGDLLTLKLENDEVLTVTFVEDESEGHFTFEERWMPQSLIDLTDTLAPKLADRNMFRSEFKATGISEEGYIAFLSARMRKGLWVSVRLPGVYGAYELNVGGTPFAVVCSTATGWDMNREWEASAPIASIEPVSQLEAVYQGA